MNSIIRLQGLSTLHTQSIIPGHFQPPFHLNVDGFCAGVHLCFLDARHHVSKVSDVLCGQATGGWYGGGTLWVHHHPTLWSKQRPDHNVNGCTTIPQWSSKRPDHNVNGCTTIPQWSSQRPHHNVNRGTTVPQLSSKKTVMRMTVFSDQYVTSLSIETKQIIIIA